MSEQTSQLAEVLYLSEKLDGAKIPPELKEKISIQIKRLRRMARQGLAAGEYEVVAKYVDWCLKVPWYSITPDNLDLNNAKQIMDKFHYGSEDVKSVVLEYLAVLNRKNKIQDTEFAAPVLAFVGVQGAGKTCLANAIAKALGRPFTRISLGALGHSSELRGSPFQNLGARPGSIVRAIVQAQAMNPVILLDEFDKVSGNEAARHDFMAIMLELLDPAQNKTFRDQYLDYPIDLSNVLFISTANRFTTIARELLDRLEFIEFEDYSMEEKLVIAKNYLFPKVLRHAGLTKEELVITEDAWPILVKAFAQEMGVRRLERNFKKLARGVIKEIVLGRSKQIQINAENAPEYAKKALPNIEEIRGIDYTVNNEE